VKYTGSRVQDENCPILQELRREKTVHKRSSKVQFLFRGKSIVKMIRKDRLRERRDIVGEAGMSNDRHN
jgi:hypothetical protein